MESTTNHTNPAQPKIPLLLAVPDHKNALKPPALGEWQKLPLLWLKPVPAPRKKDEFRDWGINE